MNVRKILHSESTWAAVIIIIASMMVFVRSSNHILIGDELRYYYKFELRPGENYFNFNNLKRVQTLSDVVDSQVNHYKCVNGRIPVHFAEQMIAAKKGLIIFYVLNTLAFASMILLFMRITLPRSRQWSPAAALIAVIGFLYLFPAPARLWMSVNLSLNYLWPSLATLGVLYCLDRLTGSGWRPSATAYAGLASLGFLTGWSNEAFAFPLSGALFLYFALNIKKFDVRARALVIPLWIGALIMLASPGNWIRALQSAESVSTFFDVLLELKIIWLLLLTAIISTVLNRKATWSFIRHNYVIITALLLAVAMGVLAHTAPRAFTAIELFSAILLMRAAAPVIPALSARNGKIAFGALLLLFVTHQTMITLEHRRHHSAISHALKTYRVSRTGTVRYDYRPSPPWLAPFAYSQVPTPNGADYEWRLLGISRCGLRKPFTALSPEQYNNIDTITTSAPESSPLHPFTKIAGGYFAPLDSTIAVRYDATAADGRQMTVTRRMFISPAGRIFAMLIPPGENTEFVRIKTH